MILGFLIARSQNMRSVLALVIFRRTGILYSMLVMYSY